MSDPTYYPKTPFPNWAEDDAYPAGSDPWSGGPNKIEPVEAVRDPGVQPDDQLGAQQYNWLNHAYGRLARVAAHQPLQTWQAFSVALETDNGPGAYYTGQSESPAKGYVVASLRPKLGNELEFLPQAPFMVAFANDATGRASAYGFHWTDVAAHPDPALVLEAYGTSTGRLLLSLLADDRVWILDQFGTWTSKATGAQAADGMGSGADIFAFHQAQDRYLASVRGGLFGSTQRLAISDDDGDTWTLVDLPSADYSIVRFADDGAGVISAIATDNGDPTQLRFLRSTDNGDTWSLVNSIGWAGGTSLGGLAYSPVWGQFMFVSHEFGTVYISADGGSWTVRSGLPVRPTAATIDVAGDGPADVSGSTRVLACIGSVFVTTTSLFINGADGIVEKVGGVLYSFDCGTSWHFVGFSHLTSISLKPVLGVIAHGGRFLVYTLGVVFTSGVVWAPGEDLSVA